MLVPSATSRWKLRPRNSMKSGSLFMKNAIPRKLVRKMLQHSHRKRPKAVQMRPCPSPRNHQILNLCKRPASHEELPGLRNRPEKSRLHVLLRRRDLGNPPFDLREVPSHYTRRAAA